MKISHIKEAPLLRAYLLINQEKNKKNAFKSIQTEISKMTELFGRDFDRKLHLILFNDIDFKDPKTFQKTKDRKVEYFLQDFPQFIERPDFVEMFSHILMETKNQGSANEIFNGLNKKFKFSIENQMKLLITFFMSDTERYQEEARSTLLEKCKEIYKDKKLNSLTESTINTLITILDLIKREEEADSGVDQKDTVSQIEEFYQYFMDYDEDMNSCQTSADDIKQISDLDRRLDTGNEEPVEVEKLFTDLGPFICCNKINIANSDSLDSEIDVERLGSFIIYMLNHQKVKMDEELKEVNKIFLDSLTKSSYSSQSSNGSTLSKEDSKNLLEQSVNKELSWDLDALYKLFKKSIDTMDVNQVLNSLDDPLFCIKDKSKFDYLIEILQKLNILKEENEKNLDIFLKNLVFTKWNNEINQIEFIDFMINNEYVNENSYYSLKNYNGNKISEEIDNKILKKYTTNENLKNQYLINNWKIIDLIEILLQLSKDEFYNSVKEIFKWPIQNIPEIFAITLVNSSPDLDVFLYDELAYEVIQKVLMSKTQDKELMDEIWNSNKNLMISILSKMWNVQPDIQNMSKIFEIIKNKIPDSIPILVNSRHNLFSVNLAIFASKKGFLNLKQWLKERISRADDDFIEAILHYIKKNIISQVIPGSNNSNSLENALLSMESLATIIENTIQCYEMDKISQKTKLHCQEVLKNIFELFEEIQIESNNLEEIDKKVNQTLCSMFDGEISVDSVLEKLINYHKSEDQKEVEEYLNLIQCLFSEYQYFPGYPEKVIKKIAELFGKIIYHQILDGILVIIALKYILDGIKTGKGNMYTFGTIALNQFINKISNWPNFMNSLIDMPQIKNEKDLYQKLLKQFNESKKKEKGINSGDSRDNEGESLLEIGDKDIDIQTGNEFLDKEDKNITKQYNNLKDKLSGPTLSYDKISKINTNQENQNLISEETINKIKYIFSFPDKANTPDKIKELKTIFKDENQIKWFSQYFVNCLIITENMQNVQNAQLFPKYYEIFNELKNKELHKEIIKATIKSVIKNATINCDTLSAENRAKENLKNLGLWLSEYKISKDRPILAKDLDFKTLIINSCENGNLNLVIPFISCVFKYASNSKVFKSTNPWVCSILNLMAELNSNQNVEQGVKDEIKILFKNLKADINSWPKTKELENCQIKTNSPYYGQDVDKEYFSKKIAKLDDYINNLLGIFNSDPNLSQKNFQRKSSSNNNNANNDNNNQLYTDIDITNILSEVMANSIQEIIPYIIDKNVKSSIVTSIFLVNKDFMYEKDENKYISSLENTMNVLAMSLSTMNTKDLLKQYICAEFDKILYKKNLTKKTIEKIKQQPKSEFLSIGLDYIQNFINKEAPKILRENSSVKEVLEKRRQNNMNNNGGNNVFIDDKHYKDYTKIMKNLPDKLHPNETCITEEEYKIYENFGKLFESMNNSIKEENEKNSFLNTIYRILKEVLDNTAANKATILDYDFCMKNIQNTSQKIDLNSDENDLICLEKIVSECKITDKNLEIEFVKKTLDYAINSIKDENILLLNVYSHILKGWVTLNPEISEEIIKHLLGLNNIYMRYNFDIYHLFLKKKIIDYEKLDKYLRQILDKNGSDILARDLFEKLFQKIKLKHSYYFDRNAKYYYALFTNKSQISSRILDIIKTPILNKLKQSELNNLGKIATYVLDHLTKCYLKDEDKEDVVNILKNEMNEMKNDTIKGESKNKVKMDMMGENNLYKIILIICEMCIKGPLENQKNSLYSCFPDNLAISIYIIVYMQEKTDKLKLFTKIICNYIMTFFEKDYIRDINDNFINQRGYFRFFYNLIYLLNKNQSEELFFDSEHKRINYLFTIIDFLKKNSPTYFTGFTMGWLELVSCNIFISNFLEPPPNPQHQKKKDKGEKYEKYEKYLTLLLELLNYLDSLNSKEISDYNFIIFLEQVHKFFFLLANSYPDFISKYYYQLITCLSGDSSQFIQLKNILLSAHPDNAPIVDIENGVISSSNEEESKNEEGDNNNLYNIKNTATILFDSGNALEKNGLKNHIDKYINEENENHLSNLAKKISNIEDEKEVNKICNMIIIYWSQSKHKYNLNEKSIKSKEILFKFYEYLFLNLKDVQRDILINAILNSLRFPCVQTFAYSNLFQKLFFDIGKPEIKEHMLNNLLIRLLYKPLPWGLKFTFTNMNKTDGFQKMVKPYLDKYNLWEAFCKISNRLKVDDLSNLIDI